MLSNDSLLNFAKLKQRLKIIFILSDSKRIVLIKIKQSKPRRFYFAIRIYEIIVILKEIARLIFE